MTHTALETPNKVHQMIFEQEFYPLADALFTFAMRLTTETNRAEDLVQETFLKAWKNIERYQVGTNPKAWLFTICKHLFINEYRSKKKDTHTVNYDEIVAFHNEDDPTSARYLDFYEEMHNQLMGDEVTRAINDLTEVHRQVILLDLEDFSYQEMASIAEVPVGTVRSRLHRARLDLAKKLYSYAEARGINVTDNEKNLECSTIVSE